MRWLWWSLGLWMGALIAILVHGCGDGQPSPPNMEERCHAKGGVFVYIRKSRDVCLKRDAVLEYEEYK
jgi:hypothetical protein